MRSYVDGLSAMLLVPTTCCPLTPTGQGLKRRSSLAASNEGAKALEQAYQRQFAASQNVVKNYKAQTATEKARCAGRG